jgi:mRNA interferase YafQ
MKKPVYKKQLKKDLKREEKSGKNMYKIKQVIAKLIREEPLEMTYKDHKLRGEYKDCRELHVEPNWLLIYRSKKDRIIFERTGSHSELFD